VSPDALNNHIFDVSIFHHLPHRSWLAASPV
jgi:hypothetical protein